MSQDSNKTLPISSVEEELVILYNPDKLQHIFKYLVLKSFNIGNSFESQYQILEGYINVFIYENYVNIEGKEIIRLNLEEGSEQIIDILEVFKDTGHIIRM